MLASIAHISLTYCYFKPYLHGLRLANMFIYIIKFWTNLNLTTHIHISYITLHHINLSIFPINNIGSREFEGPRTLPMPIKMFFLLKLAI